MKNIENRAIGLKIGAILFAISLTISIFHFGLWGEKGLVKEMFLYNVCSTVLLFPFLIISEEWQKFIFDKKYLKVIMIGFKCDFYKNYTIKYKTYSKVILSDDKVLTLENKNGEIILQIPIVKGLSQEQLEFLLRELKRRTVSAIDEDINTNENHKNEIQKILKKRKLEL